MASFQDLCEAFRLTPAQASLYQRLRRASKPVTPCPNEKVSMRKLVQCKLAHEVEPGKFIAGYGWSDETGETYRGR